MQTHRLKPDSFGVIKRNLLKKFLGTSLAVCFIAPVAAIWGLGMGPFGTLTVVAVLITIFILNYFRCLKIQKKDAVSYELILGEDSIIKKQAELPEVEIHRNQVTGIHETVGAGLLIVTEDCYKYIFIPAILENYDDVKNELRYWKPIEVMPVRRSPVMILLRSSIVATTFMATILAKSIWIYVSSGILLNIILVVTLYELHNNEELENRTHRKRMVMYLLVLSISVFVLRILQQAGIWW